MGVIFGAHFSRNGETWRNGDTNQVHLRKVGSFTTEQLSHLSVTFGLFVTESIDSFRVRHIFLVLCDVFCFLKYFNNLAILLLKFGLLSWRTKIVFSPDLPKKWFGNLLSFLFFMYCFGWGSSFVGENWD